VAVYAVLALYNESSAVNPGKFIFFISFASWYHPTLRSAQDATPGRLDRGGNRGNGYHRGVPSGWAVERDRFANLVMSRDYAMAQLSLISKL
jgi:hypothetical protein